MSLAWKAVIDADLADAEYKPRLPIAAGTYPAIVSGIEAKTFETGSKGVQVTFTLTTPGEEKGREIRDYYVIQAQNGEHNRSGAATLKKLMLDCGLNTKDIQGFRYPDFDSKSFGDFKKLLDQPVVLTIAQEVQKKGKRAGQTVSRVKNFVAGQN